MFLNYIYTLGVGIAAVQEFKTTSFCFLFGFD